jgi:hypothetical protein
MKHLLASLCITALGTAFANATDKQQSAAVDIELTPGQMHEECMRLEPGAKRRWYWKSSGPVDFNIHYHRETEVFYPVKRERMRGDGGTFTAKTGEDYCWMWTAKSGARIEGRID